MTVIPSRGISPRTGHRPDPTRRRLSEPRRRLLSLMQRMQFCRIEQLAVHGGEPVFDPLPRVIRTIRISGRNLPRPQVSASDFALKREWVELFAELDAIGNGTILGIEVAHGLPLFLEIEQTVIL